MRGRLPQTAGDKLQNDLVRLAVVQFAPNGRRQTACLGHPRWVIDLIEDGFDANLRIARLL
jgi:hypothetical protein